MAPIPALHSPSAYNSPSNNGNAYRSTPDSRSSVLNRAREYTRRVEDEERRRSRSLSQDRNNTPSYSKHSYSNPINVSTPPSQRSYRSAHPSQAFPSPVSYGSNRGREESSRNTTNSQYNSSNTSYRSHSLGRKSNEPSGRAESPYRQNLQSKEPPGRAESPYRRSLSIKERAQASVEKESRSNTANNNNNNTSYRTIAANNKLQEPARQPPYTSPTNNNNRRMSPARSVRSRARSLSRGRKSTGESQPVQQQQPPQPEQQGNPIVSPELLVDALSGHEDGLLAIAERLMEHYDAGYDAMGEAIIDAFADVQKLFQHVVEAAHMEGAAFESSRREEEIRELKQRAARGDLDGVDDMTNENDPSSPASNGPIRHDEFIDEDVKECLNDAIRSGISFKEENRHAECFQLYEQACQAASALLPVDSDHRGRLQLSIARAESMSPDRGCAILRYAMDDVLRSGLRAGKIPKNYSMDVSKRADVVLSKPSKGITPQSSEEQLNSLVDEMKEIINAPIYEDTPLQDVAKRFWNALHENHKVRSKNEARLEHDLGKLKGDYLLARAEWEEKLNAAKEEAAVLKRKYNTLKDGKEVSLMEDARSMMSQKFSQSLSMNESSGDLSQGENLASASFRSATSRPEFKRATESVASMGSNLAAHAKTLVGTFACANEQAAGKYVSSERATEEWRDRQSARHQSEPRSSPTNRSYRDSRRDI